MFEDPLRSAVATNLCLTPRPFVVSLMGALLQNTVFLSARYARGDRRGGSNGLW